MLEKVKEKTIMLYSRYTVVRRNTVSGRIEVRRQLSLGKNFPTLVKLILVAKMLEEFGGRPEEIELERLRLLRDRLFSRNEKMNAMISSDLHRIEQIQGMLSDEWCRLRDYFKELGGYDHRNFLAHSGLEKNATEIRMSKGRIVLRYCREHLRDVVRDSARGLTPA